jgi:hypothetical protein
MADKHLNLFYTYNRDNELIENNLTRALIVSLAIVSGETRHHILSKLLKSTHKTNTPTNIESLDFTNTQFALQSNIDRSIPKNSGRKLLLTISTEPLDISTGIAGTDMELTDETGDGSNFTSIPDAWVYDDAQTYCILIEAKVGSYPLAMGQLQSHAMDWFGSSLQSLNISDALYSITWIDVLEILRNTLKERVYADSSEEKLITHIMKFISYYGYRLFDGVDFSDLNAPPDLMIGNPSSQENKTLSFNLHELGLPPDFMLTFGSLNSR